MVKSQLVRGRFYVVKLEGTKDASWGADTVVQLIESDKTGIRCQRKDGTSLVLKTARFVVREVPGFDALVQEAERNARVVEAVKQHNATSPPNPWPERVQKGGQHTLATTDADLDNYNPVPEESKMKQSAFPVPKSNKNDAPHLIVVARAGTGKTTTLVEGLKVVLLQSISSHITPSPQQQAVWDSLALSRGVSPGSVCFAAFNKSIADELKRRVPAGVTASTMHGLGYAAVRNAYGNVKVDEGRVQNLLSQVAKKDIRELRREDSDAVFATERLVSLCKMNLVWHDLDDTTSWEESLDTLVSHYEIELVGNRSKVYGYVPKVLDLCRRVEDDRAIDFSDMIWIPVINNLSTRKYSLLLVDEAQDLNRCQQALARKLGDRLVLCGDPRQAIYGFAGADAESMPRMREELGATPRGVQVLPLTVTRRCGKKIVEEARKIVDDFEAFHTNPEGTISHMNLDAASQKAYQKVAAHGDMVLCRVNAPLVSECFRFLKQGRKANIQGRDVGRGLISTVNKLNAESVPDLVSKLSDWLYAEHRKEMAKRTPSESRVIALQDRHDCIVAFTEGRNTVKDVIAAIESVFTDNPDAPGIRLSSIHKAKGLEARRVFLLEPKGSGVPHPMAKGAWQIEQEWNLRYVAVTRAIEELVYVSG